MTCSLFGKDQAMRNIERIKISIASRQIYQESAGHPSISITKWMDADHLIRNGFEKCAVDRLGALALQQIFEVF
ncbi:hypothetical protein NY99_22175 [Xanthomonas phaseoli pv. phaseoli]|nr:hypothetical protein NY99_22175 [Xanthomonas phaseoli pv. phaseoli]KHF46215.1 hypothetical protein QQ30_23000 [Xanthomonas phaseoli pv. phaseoli]KHS21120.1 hypothetical protein RM60_22080 [Xanthomonas phaseoli pv. phaseoli]